MALWHIPWTPIADFEMWILSPAGSFRCFILGNSLNLTVPQFIHVYKWVPARRLFSLSSIHECSTIFSSTVKTAEPPPPLLFHFLFIFVQLTSVSFISAKIFQNWSTSAGYEESVGGFEPIRKGEILNECYKLIIIRTKFSKSIFVGFHH